MSLEAEPDIQTRYEIFARLETDRQLVIAEGIGHLMAKEAWERIDLNLDLLIDLDGISRLVDTETML